MKDLKFLVRLVLEETYIWITCLGLLNFWEFEPGEQTYLHHMVVLLGGGLSLRYYADDEQRNGSGRDAPQKLLSSFACTS